MQNPKLTRIFCKAWVSVTARFKNAFFNAKQVTPDATLPLVTHNKHFKINILIFNLIIYDIVF